MSYNYIDEINNNMSLNNSEVYNKLKKKLNRRDIAILDLLSKGNSILFIGNSSLRTKLYNALSILELEYLICDFDEDIYEESFFEYIIEDFELYENFNIDDIFTKKNELELKMNILSRPYSNLQLSPSDLKEKRDYYLKKLDGHEIIYPIERIDEYNFESVKLIANNINEIVQKYNDLFYLKECISYDFFKNEDYDNLIFIKESFIKSFDKFAFLNAKLTKLMGIKEFDNLNSVEFLKNLDEISNNNIYIDEKDLDELNILIKNFFNDSSLNLETNPLINKYSISPNNMLNDIEKKVKYSELINEGIISRNYDESKLIIMRNDITILIGISKYLKKLLFYISTFYSKYECFDLTVDSFNLNNSIFELKTSFDKFCNDLDKLTMYKTFLEYSYTNEDEKFFIDLVSSKKVDKDIVCDIFMFNVCNYALNNFLKESIFTEDSEINIENIKQEFSSLNEKLGENSEDQFINLIKMCSVNLNKNEVIMQQKIDLKNKLENINLDSIFEILKEYKQLITANRRIFMIDEESIHNLYDINYIHDFDYVIKNDEIMTNTFK